ncbi:MAG: hypothetical protein HY320_06400 [Armatimonadetes bacterium]|nr:hypothetical protein [Armatimonadota bacterium]
MIRPWRIAGYAAALVASLERNFLARWRLNRALGCDVLNEMKSGKGALRNPPGTEWHHPVNAPEALELLRRSVHRDPRLQGVLHPDRLGGYAWYYRP